MGCSSLASVTIPNSVTNLGESAFRDCKNLKKIIIMAVIPPKIDRYVFDGVNKRECTLYVPEESLEAYKSAPQWKDFFNIETSIKGTLKSVSATEEERYTIGGTRIASPQKGINIIRMSDGTVKKVLVK